MNTTIIATLITAFGGIMVAALTFYLSKRHETKAEWQKQKLNHYKVLISSISDLAGHNTNNEEANMRYFLAANTIALIAPQYVISAFMAFQDQTKITNPNRSQKEHDKLLIELLLAIRRDIGLAEKDDPMTFDFHLIG
jgi:proline dehydrogenase